MVSILTEFR